MKKIFFTKSKPEILNPPIDCLEKDVPGSISLILGVFCGIVISTEESFVLKPEIFAIYFLGFVLLGIFLSKKCKE